jgi:hypothetical protein
MGPRQLEKAGAVFERGLGKLSDTRLSAIVDRHRGSAEPGTNGSASAGADFDSSWYYAFRALGSHACPLSAWGVFEESAQGFVFTHYAH